MNWDKKSPSLAIIRRKETLYVLSLSFFFYRMPTCKLKITTFLKFDIILHWYINLPNTLDNRYLRFHYWVSIYITFHLSFQIIIVPRPWLPSRVLLQTRRMRSWFSSRCRKYIRWWPCYWNRGCRHWKWNVKRCIVLCDVSIM